MAGISIGLVTDDEKFVLLSDILGTEDHHGDMDFKIAGSAMGITSMQLDVKLEGGVPLGILENALDRARSRIHIYTLYLSP